MSIKTAMNKQADIISPVNVLGIIAVYSAIIIGIKNRDDLHPVIILFFSSACVTPILFEI